MIISIELYRRAKTTEDQELARYIYEASKLWEFMNDDFRYIFKHTPDESLKRYLKRLLLNQLEVDNEHI